MPLENHKYQKITANCLKICYNCFVVFYCWRNRISRLDKKYDLVLRRNSKFKLENVQIN